MGRGGGCSGNSSLHVWRGFSTTGKPEVYNLMPFFLSEWAGVYTYNLQCSIQTNVKICLNCTISPLLSMTQGNWCYVLNFHPLAPALDNFTFLALLQVSFTVPLNPPDICSFGLLVCFLLSNPSFQVYHPFSLKGPHNPVGEHLLLGTRILMYFYQNTFILKTPYNFFLRWNLS